ncbi:MAG: ATP-dependent helicase HrpB, partial [Kiritimatiellia bacterium]
MQLPISPLKTRVLAELASRPVVVTAPTGSGKSTEVPRWCQHFGRVLVVEPRRMACRGLGQRVAQLEKTNLGEGVGYVVRDDRRATDRTRIVFATPGVVLRWLQNDGLAHFDVVLLDEFHERSLELDLLLALLMPLTNRLHLGALSATLEADRLATHLGGVHIHGEGRTFPVDIHYLAGSTVLPDARGLESRLQGALAMCSDADGDILVFLPGKGEIRRMAQHLGDRHGQIVQLHGGLTLKEQARVFVPSPDRRVILSTNVAETSVTLPSIGVVIDSGLVRRTRYHQGRASLTLTSIAADSADQRAGRAGRVKAGKCFRLWAERAPLAPRTPPEIHRESLVPLVLAASACGASVHELPFLDAPRPYAVIDAEQVLHDLGATDQSGLTERGRRLFQLPLDAPLGRLLVQAEHDGTLGPIIDLVATLQVS